MHRTRCYSHPAQRLAQLRGAALLAPLRCGPSAMQSTGEPYHPANKMRLLMRLSCWDPVLSGILLPKSAYWNGRISTPRLNPTSQIDIRSVAAMGARCIKSERLRLWSRATLSCFLLISWPEMGITAWTVKALFGLPVVPKIRQEIWNVKANVILHSLNSR